MYGDLSHPQANTIDQFDEFLSGLLNDTPDVLPALFTTPAPASTCTSACADSAFTPSASFPSSSAIATTTSPYTTTPGPHLTCKWLSALDLPLVCNTPLPADPKHVCTHFRHVHHIHGNEKAMVQCQWHDCLVSPMQRGSLIRHVLTVHLGLLRWRCEVCGRTFSRKGAVHTCVEDA